MQIQLITRAVLTTKDHAVMQLDEALGRSQVRFPIVQLEFFIGTILPSALWSWAGLIL